MNIKKGIALTFSAMTLLSCADLYGTRAHSNLFNIPLTATAAKSDSTVTVGDLTFQCKITGADTVSMTKLISATEPYINIPETVAINGQNYTVTEIGKSFSNTNYCLEEVTIPRTVVKIGRYAFGNTAFLTKVNGGENVSQVGHGAFNNSAWMSAQRSEKGYVLLGKALLDYDASAVEGADPSVIDLSDARFEEVMCICPFAFSRDSKKITTLILPKRLSNLPPDGSKGMFGTGVSTVAQIYYYDAELDSYMDLKELAIRSERTEAETEFLMAHYQEFSNSVFGEAVTLELAKKIFEKLEIAYVENPEEVTLTETEEYAIVRKIYFEVHKNDDYKYNANASTKSVGFQEDLVTHKGMLCAEYADLYCYLLSLAGVNVQTVNGSNHAWNIVQIGEEWFNVDICKTWYQPATVMTTDEAIASVTSHNRNLKSQLLPACIIRMGDVTLDGVLDESDAALVAEAYQKLLNGEDTGFTEFQTVLADADRNGYIDENDAVWIRSYYEECENGYTGFLENYMKENGMFESVQ